MESQLRIRISIEIPIGRYMETSEKLYSVDAEDTKINLRETRCDDKKSTEVLQESSRGGLQ
jgi:hypothetical protein